VKKIPTEVYSRVCGYFRPVRQWHIGKKEEYSERKVVDVNKIQEQMLKTEEHNV